MQDKTLFNSSSQKACFAKCSLPKLYFPKLPCQKPLSQNASLRHYSQKLPPKIQKARKTNSQNVYFICHLPGFSSLSLWLDHSLTTYILKSTFLSKSHMIENAASLIKCLWLFRVLLTSYLYRGWLLSSTLSNWKKSTVVLDGSMQKVFLQIHHSSHVGLVGYNSK